MAQEPNAIEQAVSRALRDNLERIQRTSDELHQAINDVVSACASSKPSNALPPMLRAQTGAASLAAALDVLSRFVTLALQVGPRSPLEAEMTRLVTTVMSEPGFVAELPALGHQASEINADIVASTRTAHPVEAHVRPEPLELQAESDAAIAQSDIESDFDVNRLSPEEQELHRRANRVAKVSMQDIRMLHPDQVRLGREHKDICIRLRDDIEKAHREYDRRFRPIMDHPVDYFYRWLVEILAEGDAHALGEYPYATPARQH